MKVKIYATTSFRSTTYEIVDNKFAACKILSTASIKDMDKNKSSTRKAVIDSALSLLQQKGYNGWSYEDIAKSVGIKKATIHYYFPKKEDLGKELIVLYSKNSMNFLRLPENVQKSPQDKLLVIVDLFSAVLDNPNMFCLCGMLAADLPTLSDSIALELAKYFENIEKHIAFIFEEGINSKIWKLIESPSLEAKSLIAAFQGMLLLSRMQGGKSYFIEMANNYISKIK